MVPSGIEGRCSSWLQLHNQQGADEYQREVGRYMQTIEIIYFSKVLCFLLYTENSNRWQDDMTFS